MTEFTIGTASKADLQQILDLQKVAYLSEAKIYNDLKWDLPPVVLGECQLNQVGLYGFNLPLSHIFWNNLGFEIIFSCQDNLAFQKAKKTFLCC